MLTDTALKSLKPRETAYEVTDRDGYVRRCVDLGCGVILGLTLFSWTR
jgi:hypothetical protein